MRGPPTVFYGVLGACLASLGCGLWLGRLSVKPEVRYETKETIRWREKIVQTAQASASVARNERVRAVTRWLRPDKTVVKEQICEIASTATSTQASLSSAVSQSDIARDLKLVTVNARTYQPRLHVAGMLGLDLRSGARREWGLAINYRVVGPVTIGAWALPGARIVGASVGVSF